jgi:Mrp family chromosome partitioning ATPase
LSEANELITKARLEISKREEAVIEVKKASDRIQKEINQGLISNREGRLKNLMNELRVYEQAIARSSDSDKVGTTQALKKQLAQVRSKIAQEVERGNGKMEIANLQSLLSANEANLVEQESALRAARKQLEYGESQAKKFERQLSAIPELSADLSKLTLVQTQQRKLLELLTQRYLEAQIESDTKIDQFYVTETATLVDSEKLGKLPILLSLLAVITIAVLCAVVMYDLAKGVILTKQQLLRFQLPHYAGAVPFASELRNRHADTVVNEIGVGFRLAHILKRHLFEDAAHGPAKVVAVTSKTSRVGKTVTSLGVATAMQSRGLKTLVVDVDYLAKGRALRNQISGAMHHVTRVEHLVSGPGPVPLNLHKKQKLTLWSISEEFDTEESITNFFVKDFSGILENLKSQYDCIIIDCAPCFVSTMLIVYEQADLTVLCFAEGVSTVDDVASATELIAPACKDGAKIYSALTIARLKSNAIAARGSDGFYYKSNRAA